MASSKYMLCLILTLHVNFLSVMARSKGISGITSVQFEEPLDMDIVSGHHKPGDIEHHPEYEHSRPSGQMFGFEWHSMWLYVCIPGLLLLAALAKILYDNSFLYKQVPESCILICLGIFVGAIVHYSFPKSFEHGHHDWDTNEQFDEDEVISDILEEQEAPSELVVLTADRFFLILLPPIILESAYQLHDRAFFMNLGPIFLYAFMGTLMNIFFIGLFLWIMGTFARAYTYDNDIPPLECILFATVISAVDPVAVLSIFQELKINHPLYFIVFGESLYNDAVVITVYHVIHGVILSTMTEYSSESNIKRDLLYGVFKIIYSFFGGLLIGFVFALFTSILTRFRKHVRVTEPLVVIIMAYLSYIFAEMVWCSGIVSLVTCGLLQTAYIQYNLTEKSNTTIKYVVKILAVICEIIIFFFLGRAFIVQEHVWDSGFIVFAIIAVIVFRFLSVFLLTLLVNNWFKRNKPIKYDEQILMACGGLRGAIAFALSYMMDSNISTKKMFVTTTLFIILFTVICLGTVTKPLVYVLKVRRQDKRDPRTSAFINNKVIETFVVPLIEEFAGHHRTNWWMNQLEKINNKFLKRALVIGGQQAATDRREYLDMNKNDNSKSGQGPFKDIAEYFNPKDFTDGNVDPLIDSMKQTNRTKVEAHRVIRNRVQPSKNIGQAFADSKAEPKKRTNRLYLGLNSKAPIFKHSGARSQKPQAISKQPTKPPSPISSRTQDAVNRAVTKKGNNANRR